jgi:hypothetical protein
MLVIEAIDPIDVLSAPQRELLGELAAEHAELGGDVAIYWLRNNPRRSPQAVVAPVSDDLRPVTTSSAKDGAPFTRARPSMSRMASRRWSNCMRVGN